MGSKYKYQEMKLLEDKQLVRICLEELISGMGYDSFDSLSQRDFEHLCEIIEEKTGIIISLSTMKRLFAGKFERLPQVATLNAITQSLGYQGWGDFKTHKILLQPNFPSSATSHLNYSTSKQKRNKTYIKILSIGGILSTLSLFSFLLLIKNEDGKSSNTDATLPIKEASIQFGARKVEDQGVPNSVVFNYNIDHLKGDSFFIQQSWDADRRVAVTKNNYTLTDIYYEPGFHKAKLISDNKIIKEIPVSIPTLDWIAYKKSPGEPYPQYIKNSIIHDNLLGITIDDLKKNQIELKGNENFYYSYFPPDFEISSEDFIYKARLRTHTAQPTRCPFLFIGAYGENSMIYFTTSIPGCISDIKARIGNKLINGKTRDLSGFGKDLSVWHTMEIHTKDRKVKVFIDGKLAFEERFNKPVGYLKGLGFISNGLCEVDWVELRDSTGKIAYRNEFDRKV